MRIFIDELPLLALPLADGTRTCCGMISGGYAEIDLRDGSVEGIWLADFNTPRHDRRHVPLKQTDGLYQIICDALLLHHAADIQEAQEAAGALEVA